MALRSGLETRSQRSRFSCLQVSQSEGDAVMAAVSVLGCMTAYEQKLSARDREFQNARLRVSILRVDRD